MYLGKGSSAAMHKHRRCVKDVDLILAGILFGVAGTPRFGDKTPRLFWAEIVVGLLIGQRVLRGCLTHSFRLRVTGVEKWVMLYLGIALATLPMAVDYLHSVAVMKLHVMPLIVFVLTYNSVRTEEDAQHLFVSLVLFGATVALLTLIGWSRYYSGTAVLDEGFGFKDMAQIGWGRSNYLASIFIILIPLSLATLVTGHRLMGIAATMLLSIALTVTQSRGALLSLALAVFFWFLLSILSGRVGRTFWRNVALFLVLSGVGVLAITILPQAVVETFVGRLFQLESQSLSDLKTVDRIAKLLIAWPHIVRHPLLGIGIGNQDVIVFPNRGSVHNLYFELLLETGVFAFLAFLAFLAGCWRNLHELWNVAKGNHDRMIAASCTISFIAALINAAVEPSFWGVQYAYIFWMMMALCFALVRIRSAPAGDQRNPLRSEPDGGPFDHHRHV